MFNISQNNAIGTVRLGETGSGIRDMAWLPSQVQYVELQVIMFSQYLSVREVLVTCKLKCMTYEQVGNNKDPAFQYEK